MHRNLFIFSSNYCGADRPHYNYYSGHRPNPYLQEEDQVSYNKKFMFNCIYEIEILYIIRQTYTQKSF